MQTSRNQRYENDKGTFTKGKIHQFPRGESTTLGNDSNIKENTFEAKDFPVTINIPAIQLNPGEKVTVKIIQEHIARAYSLHSIDEIIDGNFTNSSDFPPQKKLEVSADSEIIAENVTNNADTDTAKSDKINNNEKDDKERDLMIHQKDYFIKLLEKIQNIALVLGFTMVITFIILALVNVIVGTDALFAITFCLGFVFIIMLDKFYRRSINNGAKNY